MKINKLKVISVAVCCLVVALWSETQCMEHYNENVKSYVPSGNLTNQNFIDDTNEIISKGKIIEVINLTDKGLINNETVNHILANIANFDQVKFLNLDGTQVTFSINILKTAMPKADIRKVY